MLNLVAQATLNSIIKRSQVGIHWKWWVGFHHKNRKLPWENRAPKDWQVYIRIYIYILSLGDVGFLLFFLGRFRRLWQTLIVHPQKKRCFEQPGELNLCVCVWNLLLGYPSFPVLVTFSTIWPTYFLHFWGRGFRIAGQPFDLTRLMLEGGDNPMHFPENIWLSVSGRRFFRNSCDSGGWIFLQSNTSADSPPHVPDFYLNCSWMAKVTNAVRWFALQ